VRTSLHLVSILAISLVAACGDDDAPPGVDGPTVCTGHLCEPGLSDPEGGNIIFEYIYFDTELQAAFQLPAGVTTATRVMAYFMNAQNPNANPLPTPGVCNNLEPSNGWPLFVGTQHTDLDVGTLTFTGKNEANADVTITAAKIQSMTDAIGRPHDIFYQTVIPDAGANEKSDSSYTVKMGGAGDIPATTMTDAIFLAKDFTVKSPDIEDNGPLIAGTDFPVEWNPAVSANLPEGDTILGVTWLVDTNGKPTHMCPTLHSEGRFVIPGAAITEYKAIATARGAVPTKMILLRNAIDHRLQRLPNGEDANPRRINMLSVNCWAQLMDVQ